jgi:cysteine-rich repeat protein
MHVNLTAILWLLCTLGVGAQPYPGQRREGSVDVDSFVVQVEGSGVSTQNRIKLLDFHQTCGEAEQSPRVYAPNHFTYWRNQSTTLEAANVRVTMTGLYRLCWWSGTGGDTFSAYTLDVGELRVIAKNEIIAGCITGAAPYECPDTTKMETGDVLGLVYPSEGWSERNIMYVAAGHALKKVYVENTPPQQVVAWIGTPTVAGFKDGSSQVATFNTPRTLVASSDHKHLFIVDSGNHAVRKYTVATDQISTIAGTGKAASSDNPCGMMSPWGLAITPNGQTLYVTEFQGHRIRRINVGAPGACSTVAGSGVPGMSETSTGQFNMPAGIGFLPGSTTDSLIVSDAGNGLIRKITWPKADPTTLTLTILAGNPEMKGLYDGIAEAATFIAPMALCMTPDFQFAYVIEEGSCVLRQIDLSSQVVMSLIGQGQCSPMDQPGIGTDTHFKNMRSCAVHYDGRDVYLGASPGIRRMRRHKVVSVSVTAQTSSQASAESSVAIRFGLSAGLKSLNRELFSSTERGELQQVVFNEPHIGELSVLQLNATGTDGTLLESVRVDYDGAAYLFPINTWLETDFDSAPPRASILNINVPPIVGDQDLFLFAGTPARLDVNGKTVSASNRILITKGICGESGIAPEVIVAPGVGAMTTPEGFAVKRVTYSGVTISTPGTYKVCWWNGVVGTDTPKNYKNDIGHLTVYHELHEVGCFHDQASNRDMTFEIASELMSPTFCAKYCKMKNANNRYAGVQNSNQCYCSSSSTRKFGRTVDADCATTCSGDAGIKCGGGSHNTVYLLFGPGLKQVNFDQFKPMAPFSLSLTGYHMSLSEKIILLDANKECGKHTMDLALVTAPPTMGKDCLGGRDFSKTWECLTFDEIICQAGTYKICWWDVTGSSLDDRMYKVEVGNITVSEGPKPGQAWTSHTSHNYALQIRGNTFTDENRVLIVGQYFSCGVGSAVSSVTLDTSQSGTISGDLKSISFQTVATARGIYKVCWSTSGTAVAQFEKMLGYLTVDGPNTGLTWKTVTNRMASISITGTGLGTANRLLIVSSSDTCGSGSAHSAVVSISTVKASTTTSDRVIAFDVRLSATGTFKACWWNGVGTESSSQYVQTVGELTVEGPNVNRQIECYIKTGCTLILTGSGLENRNKLVAVRMHAQCGAFTEKDVAGEFEVNLAECSSTSCKYLPLELGFYGTFRLCWFDGLLADSLPRYRTLIGTVTVIGPVAQQVFFLVRGMPSKIQLEGTKLTASNRILLIDSTATCGTVSQSSTVEIAPGVPTISADQKIAEYSGVKVSSVASLKVCWSEGSSGTNSDSFKAHVGSLQIYADAGVRSNVNPLCMVNEQCNLVLEGLSLATSNRVYVTSLSTECQQTNNPSSSGILSGPLSSTGGVVAETSGGYLTFSVSLGTAAQYRVCFWNGQSSTFYVNAGILDVRGPFPHAVSLPFNEVASITISGTSLNPAQNRLKLVDWEKYCGHANGTSSRISQQPGSPAGNTTTLIFDNVKAVSGAKLRLCWCRGHNGCSSPGHFNTPIGHVTIVGPTVPQEIMVPLSHNSILSVQGQGFTSQYVSREKNLQVKIIPFGANCLTTPMEATVVEHSKRALWSGSGTTQINFPGYNFTESGQFTACWKFGGEFSITLGTLRVRMVASESASFGKYKAFGDGSGLVWSPLGVTAAKRTNAIYATSLHSIRRFYLDSSVVDIIGGRATDKGYVDHERSYQARFNTPSSLALSNDDKFLYVSDMNNYCIRKIHLDTDPMAVTTLAGTCRRPGFADSPNQVHFNRTGGLALHQNGLDLYVADIDNARIRLVNALTGNVSTFAGSGKKCLQYCDGNSTSASFHTPMYLAVGAHGDCLYVSDVGQKAIRKIYLAEDDFGKLVATAVQTFTPKVTLQNPHGLAVSWTGKTLYIADHVAVGGETRGRLLELDIATWDVQLWFPEDGKDQYTGAPLLGMTDSTPKVPATLNEPSTLAMSPNLQDLWIADTGSHMIRRVVAFKRGPTFIEQSLTVGVPDSATLYGQQFAATNLIHILEDGHICGYHPQPRSTLVNNRAVPSFADELSALWQMEMGPLTIRRAGQWVVCWCEGSASDPECKETKSFRAHAGVLNVVGPYYGQTIRMPLNYPAPLKVTGVGLTRVSRISIVDDTEYCGGGSQAPTVKFLGQKPTSGDFVRGSYIVFEDVLIVTKPGKYKLCYWNGLSFQTHFGKLNVYGPYLNQFLPAVQKLYQNYLLAIRGYDLDKNMEVHLVPPPPEGSCDRLSPYALPQTRPTNVTLNETTNEWVALLNKGSINRAGYFMMCWTPFANASLANTVRFGGVWVEGPLRPQSFYSIMGSQFGLFIEGYKMSLESRVFIVETVPQWSGIGPQWNVTFDYSCWTSQNDSFVRFAWQIEVNEPRPTITQANVDSQYLTVMVDRANVAGTYGVCYCARDCQIREMPVVDVIATQTIDQLPAILPPEGFDMSQSELSEEDKDASYSDAPRRLPSSRSGRRLAYDPLATSDNTRELVADKDNARELLGESTAKEGEYYAGYPPVRKFLRVGLLEVSGPLLQQRHQIYFMQPTNLELAGVNFPQQIQLKLIRPPQSLYPVKRIDINVGDTPPTIPQTWLPYARKELCDDTEPIDYSEISISRYIEILGRGMAARTVVQSIGGLGGGEAYYICWKKWGKFTTTEYGQFANQWINVGVLHVFGPFKKQPFDYMLVALVPGKVRVAGHMLDKYRNRLRLVSHDQWCGPGIYPSFDVMPKQPGAPLISSSNTTLEFDRILVVRDGLFHICWAPEEDDDPYDDWDPYRAYVGTIEVVGEPTCGDGRLVLVSDETIEEYGLQDAGLEKCDDGNLEGGDGCSGSCQLEKGWMSDPMGGVFPICGDGFMVDGETCDDGNREAGDGCSSQCQVENGYRCVGLPSVCATFCGDGIRLHGEECDDLNTHSLDGCNSECQIETGWECNEGKGKNAGRDICQMLNPIMLQKLYYRETDNFFLCKDKPTLETIPNIFMCFPSAGGIPIPYCSPSMGQHFCMQIPAPRIVKAFFHTSFTLFYIHFDIPTNQAGEALGMVEACSILFDDDTLEVLGHKPECLWSSATELSVQLGRKSAIDVGGVVHLRAGVLSVFQTNPDELEEMLDTSARRLGECRSGSGCEQMFQPALAPRQSVILDRPSQSVNIAPTLEIFAPNLVSPCTPLAITTVATGGGGRPLRIEYSVLAAPDGPEHVTHLNRLLKDFENMTSLALEPQELSTTYYPDKWKIEDNPVRCPMNRTEADLDQLQALCEYEEMSPSSSQICGLTQYNLESMPLGRRSTWLPEYANYTHLLHYPPGFQEIDPDSLWEHFCCCLPLGNSTNATNSSRRMSTTPVVTSTNERQLSDDEVGSFRRLVEDEEYALQVHADPMLREQEEARMNSLLDDRGLLPASLVKRIRAERRMEEEEEKQKNMSFTVKVKARNFMNLEVVRDTKIRLVEQDVPVITAATQRRMTMRPYKEVTLGAKPVGGGGDDPRCADPDDVQTKYMWRQVADYTTSFRHILPVQELKAKYTKNPGNLLIPKNSMLPGFNYTFEVITFYIWSYETQGRILRGNIRERWLQDNSTNDTTAAEEAGPDLSEAIKLAKADDYAFYPKGGKEFSSVLFNIQMKQPRDPVAILAFPEMTINPDCQISLDASYSFDPNWARDPNFPKPDKAPALQYEWFCRPLDENALPMCHDQEGTFLKDIKTMSWDGFRFIIPPESLPDPGKSYEFEVKVYYTYPTPLGEVYGEAWAKTKVNIRAQIKGTPRLELEKLPDKVSIDKKLILRAYIFLEGTGSCAREPIVDGWALDGAAKPLNTTLNLDSPLAALMPAGVKLLQYEAVIKPSEGLILANKKYTFLFTLRDIDGNKVSESTNEIAGNSPPALGSVDTFPSIGEMLNTEFTLSQNGWQDDDFPLTFMFSAFDPRKLADEVNNGTVARRLQDCKYKCTRPWFQKHLRRLQEITDANNNGSFTNATFTLDASSFPTRQQQVILAPWSLSPMVRVKLPKGEPLYIIGWVKDAYGAESSEHTTCSVTKRQMSPDELKTMLKNTEKFADAATLTSTISMAATAANDPSTTGRRLSFAEANDLDGNMLGSLGRAQGGADNDKEAANQQVQALGGITTKPGSTEPDEDGHNPAALGKSVVASGDSLLANSLDGQRNAKGEPLDEESGDLYGGVLGNTMGSVIGGTNGRRLSESGGCQPKDLENHPSGRRLTERERRLAEEADCYSEEDAADAMQGSTGTLGNVGNTMFQGLDEDGGDGVLENDLMGMQVAKVKDANDANCAARRLLSRMAGETVDDKECGAIPAPGSSPFELGNAVGNALGGGQADQASENGLGLGGEDWKGIDNNPFPADTSRGDKKMGAPVQALGLSVNQAPDPSSDAPIETEEVPVYGLDEPIKITMEMQSMSNPDVSEPDAVCRYYSDEKRAWTTDGCESCFWTWDARSMNAEGGYVDEETRMFKGRLLHWTHASCKRCLWEPRTETWYYGTSEDCIALPDDEGNKRCIPKRWEKERMSDTKDTYGWGKAENLCGTFNKIKGKCNPPKLWTAIEAVGDRYDELCGQCYCEHLLGEQFSIEQGLRPKSAMEHMYCLCSHLSSFSSFVEMGGDVLANMNWDVLFNFNLISKVKLTNYGLYLTAVIILITFFSFRKSLKMDAEYGYSDRRIIRLFFRDLPDDVAKQASPPNPFAKVFILIYSSVVVYDWEFEKKKKKGLAGLFANYQTPQRKLMLQYGRRKKFANYVKALEDYRLMKAAALEARADALTDGEEDPGASVVTAPAKGGAVNAYGYPYADLDKDSSSEDSGSYYSESDDDSDYSDSEESEPDMVTQERGAYAQSATQITAQSVTEVLLNVKKHVAPHKPGASAQQPAEGGGDTWATPVVGRPVDPQSTRLPVSKKGQRAEPELEDDTIYPLVPMGAPVTSVAPAPAAKDKPKIVASGILGKMGNYFRKKKPAPLPPKIKYQDLSFMDLWNRISGRDHPILKIFVVRPHLSCTHRCMIFATALTGSIFVSALMYGTPSPSGESDEVPLELTVTPEQIWIAIFGALFNAPFPLIVTFLCRKKIILRKMKLERKLKVMKMWRVKAKIGMGIGGFYLGFCIFFLFMFSVSMKGDAILKWMVTAFTTLFNKFMLTPLAVFFVIACLLVASKHTSRLDGLLLMFPEISSLSGTDPRQQKNLQKFFQKKRQLKLQKQLNSIDTELQTLTGKGKDAPASKIAKLKAKALEAQKKVNDKINHIGKPKKPKTLDEEIEEKKRKEAERLEKVKKKSLKATEHLTGDLSLKEQIAAQIDKEHADEKKKKTERLQNRSKWAKIRVMNKVGNMQKSAAESEADAERRRQQAEREAQSSESEGDVDPYITQKTLGIPKEHAQSSH